MPEEMRPQATSIEGRELAKLCRGRDAEQGLAPRVLYSRLRIRASVWNGVSC
jgi:hypothetical protein